MSIRVSQEMAQQLISTGGNACAFGDGYYRSGFLYASRKKTDEEILVGYTGESTGLYLMRGSKEYKKLKSNYPKYGYQYDLAEKFGIKLARWMKRTGKRVFACKFAVRKDKWSALHMHQCKKRLQTELENGFFAEGEALGLTTPEERWYVNHSLRFSITEYGVVAAYDPKGIVPHELMFNYMESIWVEERNK